MASATATITICDVDIAVSYDYTPYQPATHWNPAEGGDVEITAIHIGEDSIDGMLAEWVMDKISEGIDKNIAEARREAEEDRAMARAA